MNKSGLTMTNGHVKAVTATPAGEEMVIDYGKGTDRHVLVKEGTPVTKTKELGLAALKPGLEISATTSRASDGKATAIGKRSRQPMERRVAVPSLPGSVAAPS